MNVYEVMIFLKNPLTVILPLLLLLEPRTVAALLPLKFGSCCCCCCHLALKESTNPPLSSCIARFSSRPESSTIGGIAARKLIVLHGGVNGGDFRYKSSCSSHLSLCTLSAWDGRNRSVKNSDKKQPRGLDFSCGAFCISNPINKNSGFHGNHLWRRWHGVVCAVIKHIVPLIPLHTRYLIGYITAVELVKNEAKAQINALPPELQPKAMVLYNDSVTLVHSYALQLMDMDWNVSQFVMQEWDTWRNRSKSRLTAVNPSDDDLEPSTSGPGVIARDIARLYGEATLMDLVARTSNMSPFLESTVFRLLAQAAKTDRDALDSAVVNKLEAQGVRALTVSEFFDLCSGGRIPKQTIENVLRFFIEQDIVISPPLSQEPRTANGGSAEMCELTLHEVWDKLKLQSSNTQDATTRAATHVLRSLRSNSIDMVQNAVLSSTEAMAVALQQFQIYTGVTIAPNCTVAATAQETYKWLKTAFSDFSNAFEKMIIRTSHVLTCHPSQLLNRVKYFQVFYSAPVDAKSSNNTPPLACGGGAAAGSNFTSCLVSNNGNPHYSDKNHSKINNIPSV